MGFPAGQDLKAVIITFFDITRGSPGLPSPPNGSWYCVVDTGGVFSKTTLDWVIQFWIGDIPGGGTGSNLHCDYLFVPGGHVFSGFSTPGVNDLYRIDSIITGPYADYYGGYGTIMPIFTDEFYDDMNGLVDGLLLHGVPKIFAESFGAAGLKRAIRLAKKSDGTCCYFVLPPIV